MATASPNLWDQTGDAKQNALKGVNGIRPKYNLYGDNGGYSAMANESRQVGASAQQQALDMYGNQAAGRGPSAAQAMLQQQSSQNLRTGMAMQGRARGGNIAQSGQQASAAYGGAQAQLSQQAAIMRAQEQQAGMAGVASLGGQMYQQGFNYDQLANQQAMQGDQNALGWYSAQRGMDLQQSNFDKQMKFGLANAGIGAAGAALGAAGSMSDERMKQGIQPTNPYGAEELTPSQKAMKTAGAGMQGASEAFGRSLQGASTGGPPAQAQPRQVPQLREDQLRSNNIQLGRGGANGSEIHSLDGWRGPRQLPGRQTVDPFAEDEPVRASQDIVDAIDAPSAPVREKWDTRENWMRGEPTGATTSDERKKRSASRSSSADPYSATAAIDASPAVSFEYKPGAGLPEGRRTGVMAQNLERSPAGRAIVQNTPQGKMVDNGGAATLGLAGLSEMRQREVARDKEIAELRRMVSAPRKVSAGRPFAGMLADAGGPKTLEQYGKDEAFERQLDAEERAISDELHAEKTRLRNEAMQRQLHEARKKDPVEGRGSGSGAVFYHIPNRRERRQQYLEALSRGQAV